MYRPIISLFLVLVVTVVALLASGIVKIEVNICDEDGNPLRKKSKDAIDTDKISEAEVVDEDDAEDGSR